MTTGEVERAEVVRAEVRRLRAERRPLLSVVRCTRSRTEDERAVARFRADELQRRVHALESELERLELATTLAVEWLRPEPGRREVHVEPEQLPLAWRRVRALTLLRRPPDGATVDELVALAQGLGQVEAEADAEQAEADRRSASTARTHRPRPTAPQHWVEHPGSKLG